MWALILLRYFPRESLELMNFHPQTHQLLTAVSQLEALEPLASYL